MSKEKAETPYIVTTPDAKLARQRSLTPLDRKVLAVIMLIAAGVRLAGLAWPTSVVFDEVHFGGFARKYIIGRFFFDVHPPLAKMLFAVVGWLGGYDGEFEFKNIGDDYISGQVPYITMRMLPSVLGLLTILLCYCTLRASGCRTFVAAAAALLLTFENTHATESRYILLDSPLVFFAAISAYAFKKFENEVPFQRDWYRYLLLTGLGLGATVSSKWVGLFTIGWVGALTICQLWFLVGDLSVSSCRFMKHFLFRALFLIALPVAFYMGMFYLHFMCVDNTGDGADFMSREFQSTLKHNNLPTNVPADVAFGSEITIRHVGTNGGYLHSHPHAYETGSKQQQVTLYPHVDFNNVWQIENGTDRWNPLNTTGLVWLRDGDEIRLKHVQTQKRLHSHDHRPPVTNHDYLNEVSGYGFEDFEGDLNDNWRIVVVENKGRPKTDRQIHALTTVFKLQHVPTGCFLYSKKVKLPEWGFGQQEVSCISNGVGPNILWYIESNQNSRYKDPELASYGRPTFWQKFIELNKVMWNVNKGLTDRHTWESRPLSWLTLQRGINMWGDKNRQVYLIGNLPVYYAIASSIILFVVAKLLHLLWWQRFANGASYWARTQAQSQSPWAVFEYNFGTYALAWAFHYFPSFMMDRQLFLHHYLSSVYFGVLAVGQAFELIVATLRPSLISRLIIVVFTLSAIAWYYWYSPLIYASPWTKSRCIASKFHDMDFDCNLFLEDKSDYSSIDKTIWASVSEVKAGRTWPADDEKADAAEDESLPSPPAVENLL